MELGHVEYALPDGRALLADVSFRIGDGARAAIIGPNGAGKTTLLRLVTGDLKPLAGSVTSSGGVGVMRQFVARSDGASAPTVRDLLLSVAPARVRDAAYALDRAEIAVMERDDEPAQLAYAQALADYSDAGGYEAETLWDTCCVIAVGQPYLTAQFRDAVTLSGGEQKRLMLEALLRGPDQVLVLDEPDNFLDVPGKRWLEDSLLATGKTVLYVTHDRELLDRTAERIVTVEDTPGGNTVWVHGGGYATYAAAREARNERFDELMRRWDEEHKRLKDLVRTLQQQAAISPAMASRYAAMQTRLRKFEESGPPQARPRDQKVTMRLRGGRTGVRALECHGLALKGLTGAFDTEIFYGERIAVLGANGSGKSHFLRLLAGDESVAHTGTVKLGARVAPGYFRQHQDQAAAADGTLLELLEDEYGFQRGDAMPPLRRYELHNQAEQRYGTLSGGQQARFQILRLELAGATMLLLDEPTDNLDLLSAEALQDGLAAYQGTVIAVTHDRWFARSFDRYLVFGGDAEVYESPEPVWDERRADRGATAGAMRGAIGGPVGDSIGDQGRH